jgi:hypothetical protein
MEKQLNARVVSAPDNYKGPSKGVVKAITKTGGAGYFHDNEVKFTKTGKGIRGDEGKGNVIKATFGPRLFVDPGDKKVIWQIYNKEASTKEGYGGYEALKLNIDNVPEKILRFSEITKTEKLESLGVDPDLYEKNKEPELSNYEPKITFQDGKILLTASPKKQTRPIIDVPKSMVYTPTKLNELKEDDGGYFRLGDDEFTDEDDSGKLKEIVIGESKIVETVKHLKENLEGVEFLDEYVKQVNSKDPKISFTELKYKEKNIVDLLKDYSVNIQNEVKEFVNYAAKQDDFKQVILYTTFYTLILDYLQSNINNGEMVLTKIVKAPYRTASFINNLFSGDSEMEKAVKKVDVTPQGDIYYQGRLVSPGVSRDAYLPENMSWQLHSSSVEPESPSSTSLPSQAGALPSDTKTLLNNSRIPEDSFMSKSDALINYLKKLQGTDEYKEGVDVLSKLYKDVISVREGPETRLGRIEKSIKEQVGKPEYRLINNEYTEIESMRDLMKAPKHNLAEKTQVKFSTPVGRILEPEDIIRKMSKDKKKIFKTESSTRESTIVQATRLEH